MREVPATPSCVGVRRLEMHWNGIVNACLDTSRGQFLLPLCPIRATYRINMVDVPVKVGRLRCLNFGAGEGAVVTLSNRPARLRPFLQMAQLNTQHRALDPLHAKVVPFDDVMIFLFRPPIPQYSDLSRVLGIARSYHSGLAIRAEVFSRVEAKTRDIPETAYPAPLVFGTVGLRRVFNDDQSMFFCNRNDRIHICRLAVKMDRYHGSRFGRYRGLELCRIQIECVGIDVDVNRRSSGIMDRCRRCDKCEWNRNDLVTWANARGEQGQVQCAGARIDTNRVPST